MIDGDYMLAVFHEQDEILHPDDGGTDDDFKVRFDGYAANLGLDIGSIEEAVAMYWNENVAPDLMSSSPSMSVAEYAIGMSARWFVLGLVAGRDRGQDPRGA